MPVVSSYIRPCRVTTEVIESAHVDSFSQDVFNSTFEYDIPSLFRVAVEVRISKFFGLVKVWVPIWERSCFVEDRDLQKILIDKAKKVLDSLRLS